MDTTWQVIIGSGIAGLLVTLFSIYRSYLKESKVHNEKQGLAKASIILGLSGIVLIGLGSVAGIILGLISMKGKKYRALSKIGVVLSILTLIPWILVLIFGT